MKAVGHSGSSLQQEQRAVVRRTAIRDVRRLARCVSELRMYSTQVQDVCGFTDDANKSRMGFAGRGRGFKAIHISSNPPSPSDGGTSRET